MALSEMVLKSLSFLRELADKPTITSQVLRFYERELMSLKEEDLLKALHHFARRCQWPSPHQILEQAGQGQASSADKATELVNLAVQGIRRYGKDATKARENLPAFAWTAVQEWGGWTAWADLDDQRLDRARGQVRVIIERYLKTGQRASPMIESGVSDTNTLDEEKKRREAIKRDELHSDPEKRKELANLAQNLAASFGFKN